MIDTTHTLAADNAAESIAFATVLLRIIDLLLAWLAIILIFLAAAGALRVLEGGPIVNF